MSFTACCFFHTKTYDKRFLKCYNSSDIQLLNKKAGIYYRNEPR